MLSISDLVSTVGAIHRALFPISAGNKGFTIAIFARTNPLSSILPRTPRNCGKHWTYNPIRIRTYEIYAHKLFRIRTSRKGRGEGIPRFLGQAVSGEGRDQEIPTGR